MIPGFLVFSAAARSHQGQWLWSLTRQLGITTLILVWHVTLSSVLKLAVSPHQNQGMAVLLDHSIWGDLKKRMNTKLLAPRAGLESDLLSTASLPTDALYITRLSGIAPR